MNAPRAGKRIAYLVKTFPKISETFILREILALQDQDVDLQIYALRHPEESKSHSINSEVRAPVSYLPRSFAEKAASMLWAQLLLLLCRPAAYLHAMVFLVGRAESGRYQDFLQATYLALALLRAKVAHLHAHFINEPAGVAELVHLLTGIPYSVTAHAKDIYLSPQAELVRKMAKAKFIVTCNDYNRRYLTQMGADVPIIKIYHGLDARLFQADAAVYPSAEASLVLSVGRLRPKKGFHCLVDACGLLKIGGHEFRCMIAGYGPLRGELETRIAKLGLEDTVSLTDMLTQGEVIALYKQASLFVLPCRITADGDRDGIPNVLAEAMAMELPVVSTNIAGIPELVEHNRTGILVRPEDPVELAAAIARLLDQPQLRKELGKAGRERVCQMFAAEKNAAQLKSWFVGAPPAAVDPMAALPAGAETPTTELSI